MQGAGERAQRRQVKREKVSFRGDRVSLWDDDEALEKESGDDDPILQMYLVPRNCTLRQSAFYVKSR